MDEKTEAYPASSNIPDPKPMQSRGWFVLEVGSDCDWTIAYENIGDERAYLLYRGEVAGALNGVVNPRVIVDQLNWKGD